MRQEAPKTKSNLISCTEIVPETCKTNLALFLLLTLCIGCKKNTLLIPVSTAFTDLNVVKLEGLCPLQHSNISFEDYTPNSTELSRYWETDSAQLLDTPQNN
jgi:hypothetical protein